METLPMGNSSLRVGRLGLGCMGMSEFYGPADEAESIRTLHSALDLGVNFFDTADMYGHGHNETLIGGTFKGKWSQLVLATSRSCAMPRAVLPGSIAARRTSGKRATRA